VLSPLDTKGATRLRVTDSLLASVSAKRPLRLPERPPLLPGPLVGGLGLDSVCVLGGCAAESLRRGYGAVVAGTFALDALSAPRAAAPKEHDVAAALDAGAFAADRSRRAARAHPLARSEGSSTTRVRSPRRRERTLATAGTR
jgi:hypothetical protein